MSEAPPSLKRLKSAEGAAASSSSAYEPLPSTGLTRYMGDTTLTFTDEKGEEVTLEDDAPAMAGMKLAVATSAAAAAAAAAAMGQPNVSTSQSKAGWTETEDKMVLLAVRTFGTQWSAVADQLVGRTADAVRLRHKLSCAPIAILPSRVLRS